LGDVIDDVRDVIQGFPLIALTVTDEVESEYQPARFHSID
jgi:hypothetical protein